MQPEPESPRQRIKKMDTIVAEVIRETHDAATVVLFTGNDRLEYRPGHFLTIDPHQFPALSGYVGFLEHEKQKRESPRAYSMSSSPHEKQLAVTVKQEPFVAGQTEYPPLLSPYLVRSLAAGMPLQVTGFTGPYTMPDDLQEAVDTVVHVVAGSGSVPNFSMLKFDLETRKRLKHLFIYSNKTYDDIIFRAQLDQLAARFPERLRVVHLLTRDQDAQRFGSSYLSGRLSLEVLARLIPNVDRMHAFVCGPGITIHERRAAQKSGTTPEPRFLEATIDMLTTLGFAPGKIHQESF
jgi:3-ketosteroid 9alpha-monooxygenase subunit B